MTKNNIYIFLFLLTTLPSSSFGMHNSTQSTENIQNILGLHNMAKEIVLRKKINARVNKVKKVDNFLCIRFDCSWLTIIDLNNKNTIETFKDVSSYYPLEHLYKNVISLKFKNKLLKLIKLKEKPIIKTYKNAQCRYNRREKKKIICINPDYSELTPNRTAQIINLQNFSTKQLQGRIFPTNNGFEGLSRYNNFLLMRYCESASLINPKTYKPIKHFKDLWRYIFSNDEKYLLIFFLDQTATLFNLENNKAIKKFKDILYERCNFSNDSNFLFLVFNKKNPILINLKKNKTKTFKYAPKHRLGHKKNILIMHYENDSAEIIDLEKNKPLMKFTKLSKFTLDENDQFLFVLYENNKAELISLENNLTMQTFKNIDYKNCKFSDDNRFLYIKHKNQFIQLIYLKKNQIIRTYKNIKKYEYIGYGSNTILHLAYNDKSHEFINLYSNKIIKKLKKASVSWINKIKKLLTIATYSTPDNKHDSGNNYEFINLKNLCSRKFQSVEDYTLKKSVDLLEVTFNKGHKEIIRVDNFKTILKTNKKQNCGISKNIIWFQNENKPLRLFKICAAIKPFKDKLIKKTTSKQFYNMIIKTTH